MRGPVFFGEARKNVQRFKPRAAILAKIAISQVLSSKLSHFWHP